jgi:hypothetical protein
MSCRLTTCVIGDMRRSISWRSRLSKARQDSTESTASVPSIREFELFREFCSTDVSTAACTTNLRTLRAMAAGRRDRNGNINGAVVLTASSSTLSRGVLPMVSPVVVPPSVGPSASVSCPLPLTPAPTSSPAPVDCESSHRQRFTADELLCASCCSYCQCKRCSAYGRFCGETINMRGFDS